MPRSRPRPPASPDARALRPAAVILDMDGTLLDTEALYRHAFRAALAAQGLSAKDRFYRRLIGIPSRERMPMLARRFGRRFDEARFLTDYYRARDAALEGGVPLKPGAAALLDALDAAWIDRAVVTSASRGTATDRLRRAGLLHRFDRVVSRDDVTHGKPRPDGFLYAARSLHVPPARCLAVEDSAHGVRAAAAAGMPVVMVPDLVAASPELRAACRAVAASLAEVRLLLETS